MDADLSARLERRAQLAAGVNRLALRLAALWLCSETVEHTRYPARDTADPVLAAPERDRRPDGESLLPSFARPGRHLTDRAEGGNPNDIIPKPITKTITD